MNPQAAKKVFGKLQTCSFLNCNFSSTVDHFIRTTGSVPSFMPNLELYKVYGELLMFSAPPVRTT